MTAFHPKLPFASRVDDTGHRDTLLQMAIGTAGGKLGCFIGPLVALALMAYSIYWFGISEDSAPWYGLLGWCISGLIVAVVTGMAVRWVTNRLVSAERPSS